MWWPSTAEFDNALAHMLYPAQRATLLYVFDTQEVH
jgi:hypothetical protein